MENWHAVERARRHGRHAVADARYGRAAFGIGCRHGKGVGRAIHQPRHHATAVARPGCTAAAAVDGVARQRAAAAGCAGRPAHRGLAAARCAQRGLHAGGRGGGDDLADDGHGVGAGGCCIARGHGDDEGVGAGIERDGGRSATAGDGHAVDGDGGVVDPRSGRERGAGGALHRGSVVQRAGTKRGGHSHGAAAHSQCQIQQARFTGNCPVGAFEHAAAQGTGIDRRGCHGVDSQGVQGDIGQARLCGRPMGASIDALENAVTGAGIQCRGRGGVDGQRVGRCGQPRLGTYPTGAPIGAFQQPDRALGCIHRRSTIDHQRGYFPTGSAHRPARPCVGTFVNAA